MGSSTAATARSSPNVGIKDGPLVAAAPKLLEVLRVIARRAGRDDGAVTLEQIERIALDAVADLGEPAPPLHVVTRPR